MMPDTLLYLKPNVTLNFTDAKAYCSKIPGHRLSIYKKMDQWRAISAKMDNNEPYWVVDLQKQDDNTAIWGDGTLYKDTEIGQNLPLQNAYSIARIYIFFNGTLDDGVSYRMRRFFCQANPFGVDW
ncbi:uncharacterized protein [Macrobrachium rosenbergii]|uniref:uncharacterized protein n=1 Tax=Macrobrachium rosenbergii TaxID=79674 RepID=UPI0034D53199